MRPEDDEELNEWHEQLEIKDEQIASLTAQLARLRLQRQRLHLQEMEEQVTTLAAQLRAFEHLLENGSQIARERGDTREEVFLDFLQEQFWMFGLPYVKARARPSISARNIPDLLLKRSDGFNDVVEIESPVHQLFVRKALRYEQTPELRQALAQMMDFVDDYALTYQSDHFEDQVHSYKPRGIVLIGRSDNREQELRKRQLNRYLNGIVVWTYDDLIRNAREVIQVLELGENGR